MAKTVSINRLSKNSHKIIDVSCDFKISPKCRKIWRTEHRTALKTRERNNNKIICLFCSRKLKNSGRNNRNCKYKQLNDFIFKEIDSEVKAYFLGLVASDGHIPKSGSGVCVTLQKTDFLLLQKIRDLLFPEVPIKKIKNESMYALTISSKEIAKDLSKHLGIQPGAKSKIVRFPRNLTKELLWHFLRGYFDGDGTIRNLTRRYPECSIASTCKGMLQDIQKNVCIPSCITTGSIVWSGNNALDFLGKLYDSASIYMQRKRDLYLDWCCWVPGLSGKGNYGKENKFSWVKCIKEAHSPYKSNVTDSGYDLTLVAKIKEIPELGLTYYTTGIKIQPSFGWWFMLVPRSSLHKLGYMLANNIGIIDRTYIGPIVVGLIRISDSAKPIPLPIRAIQIIPQPAVHLQLEEVNELSVTDRGTSGFGSTGI